MPGWPALRVLSTTAFPATTATCGALSMPPVRHATAERKTWPRPCCSAQPCPATGARPLSLPAADPRVMVINALTDPFERGAVLVDQLAKWEQQDTRNPTLAITLGRTAFVAGDFDRGLLFARLACDGLRQQ